MLKRYFVRNTMSEESLFWGWEMSLAVCASIFVRCQWLHRPHVSQAPQTRSSLLKILRLKCRLNPASVPQFATQISNVMALSQRPVSTPVLGPLSSVQKVLQFQNSLAQLHFPNTALGKTSRTFSSRPYYLNPGTLGVGCQLILRP